MKCKSINWLHRSITELIRMLWFFLFSLLSFDYRCPGDRDPENIFSNILTSIRNNLQAKVRRENCKPSINLYTSSSWKYGRTDTVLFFRFELNEFVVDWFLLDSYFLLFSNLFYFLQFATDVLQIVLNLWLVT